MVQEKFLSTLSNVNLWGAIIASIVIIALGYLLIKINWFKIEWKKALVGVVMKVALPALVLVGFMKNVTDKALKEQGIVLGVAFAFYIVLCLFAWLWVTYMPNKTPKSVLDAQSGTIVGEVAGTASIDDSRHRPMVVWMLLIFGSTTFFGMPIIVELYNGNGGLLAANIWNVPYRIFLYSFCFMQMKGLKFNKENIKKSSKTIFLNPIVVCTFIGLIFWLTQAIPGAGSSPQNVNQVLTLNAEGTKTITATVKDHFGTNFSDVYNAVDVKGNAAWYIFDPVKKYYVIFKGKPSGWFTFGVTMPYLYKFILVLGKLCSPLIWLAIGMTLAQSSLKEAAKDKWVWIYSAIKMIAIPLLIFAIFYPLNQYVGVNKNIAIAMLIFASTPPATVAVGFAISENKCPNLAARCSAFSTLLAVVFIPLWIVIGEVAFI